MTVKEIAEAVGKNKSTVGRWVAKCNSSISDKLQNATKDNPADFTLDETVEIIKAGMGANAAGIFRANTEKPKPEVDYEVIGKMIGVAITAALSPIVKELKEIRQPLQITAPKEDYFSLVAYTSLHGIKVNRSEMAMHGMALKKMAKEKNLIIKKIPDERWGQVNSYPVPLLDEYWNV